MDRLKILWSTLLLLITLVAGCASIRGNSYPLEKGYMQETELFARLKALQDAHPDLVRLVILGFSGTENLPLYALEIGHKGLKREVLIIGQHHGDEVLGVEISLAWAEELAAKASKDKQIESLLSQYRFWIIPTINPEGYRTVTQGRYPSKRKNNRDSNLNGSLDLRTDGVDLNRNYPVFWEEDPPLPPTHRNYKGKSPASEPEVRAVISLAQKHSFELAMFYHSSPTGQLSEKIFLPALDSLNAAQKLRYQKTLNLAEEYASHLKRDYLPGNYVVGKTPGTRIGTARNYFFHIHGAPAFLIEVGGVNKDGISVIHPPDKMRDKIVSKHLKALRKMFADNLLRQN